MEVSVSAFRSELKHWLAQVQQGEDVIITDRGVPVARLLPVSGSELIADLQRQGLLSAPETERADLAARSAEDTRPGAFDAVRRRLRR